jgi:O-antigen/teichoic acid export membrane protein
MSVGSTTAETGAARFSRNVIWTLGARLLIAFGSLVSGVIVARWLGAAAVGILASLSVLTMVSMTVGTLGVPSATTYLVARDRNRTQGIVFHAVLFALTSGVLLACVIIALTFVHPRLFGDISLTLVMITACGIPFQMLSIACLAGYLGLGNIGRYNLLDLLSQASLVVNPLVAVALLGLGLLTLVALNAVTAFILSLIVLTILIRAAGQEAGGSKMRFDRSLMAEMLGYGAKFYISMLAAVIILRADLLIVNYFRGAAEAGVYAVSAQVGTLLLLIPNVISTVLFPRVTESRDTSGDMTCRVTRHASMLMLVACLGAIPLVFLMPLLYGEAFAAVPYQVLLLLPGIYLLGIETVQVQYFTGTGLPTSIPVYWVVTLIVTIALDLLFVPLFGAYGAAAVSSVSYALVFILIARLFRRRTGKGFGEMYIIRSNEARDALNVGKVLKFRTAGEN